MDDIVFRRDEESLESHEPRECIESLITLLAERRPEFVEGVDVPAAAPNLKLDKLRDEPVRQFKRIHQNSVISTWHIRAALGMQTLQLSDCYIALVEAEKGLGLYGITRQILETHAFILGLSRRLQDITLGESRDWKSRGEAFYKLTNRALYATNDPVLRARYREVGLSNKSMETFHAKDLQEVIHSDGLFDGDQNLYAELCDRVHPNGPALRTGMKLGPASTGISVGNTLLTAPGGLSGTYRYQYSERMIVEKALAVTAGPMLRHTRGIYKCLDSLAESPYREAEVLEMTGTKSGMQFIPIQPLTPDQPDSDALLVKVGRNELCPCGSGKKFKKCCLN